MYSIGLTGNIASGKSTVSRFFHSLGVPIISADVIARELTAKDQPALTTITQHFGDVVITPEGHLDRQALRRIIFADPIARQWLESLLHPLIKAEISRQAHDAVGPYCLVEIPLLKSKADYPWLNRILVILANHEHQIGRVMARDHCDRDQAVAILSTQPDDTARKNLADDLIINSGSLAELEQQINKLHKHYLHLAMKAQ